MAYDINLWRQKMLKRLSGQASQQKASALAAHNITYGSGTTQSGGYTSAAEGIAAQEALAGAGVNEEAAQLQHERDMERQAIADAKEAAKKARKQQLIQGVVGLGLGIAGAPLLAGGTSLLGKGLSKVGLPGMQQAEQAVSGYQPPEENGIPSMMQIPPPQPVAPQMDTMYPQIKQPGFYDWIRNRRKKSLVPNF